MIPEEEIQYIGDGVHLRSSLLPEICQEEKIEMSVVSNNYLVLLEKDGKTRMIFGHKFGLNPSTGEIAASDKFAAYEVLHAAGVPVAEHVLLYDKDNGAGHAQGLQSDEYVADFFHEHGEDIVIKPNNGSRGVGVTRVTSLDNLDAVREVVFRHSYSASMCPFYDIENEYRVVILDDAVRLCYGKERGEDWRFNLSQGATVVDVTDEGLRRKLEEIARAAAKALGMRFCTVDIIRVKSGELMVIEVNSGVTITKYLLMRPEQRGMVKEIYRDAVLKMFEE